LKTAPNWALFRSLCWRPRPAAACGIRQLVSGTQSSATLCTTGIDYCTSTAGAHALTKTVSSLAFQFTGLECTFHGFISMTFKGLRNLTFLAGKFK
jgi:hypothetical protein